MDIITEILQYALKGIVALIGVCIVLMWVLLTIHDKLDKD